MDFVHLLDREGGAYSCDYFTNAFIATWAIAASTEVAHTVEHED